MLHATRELDLAYDHCRRIARTNARNFYYAFITLPWRKRQAVYAAYAFCRLCDDAADEELPGEEKLTRLAGLREELSAAYSGSPCGPVFTALADAASLYHIPQEYMLEVVAGVETDTVKNRYGTFDELRTYCYQVASVVGLVCIQIFGYSHPRAVEYAIDLGLAMQLTNILRDIQEDLGRDRVYLPQEELRDFGYSLEELQAGVVNEPFRKMMSFQAERARGYFRRGLNLVPLLSTRSRACPAVLGQLYSHILDRIEERDFNVFDGRVGLSRREKYRVVAQTWLRSLLPMSGGSVEAPSD